MINYNKILIFTFLFLSFVTDAQEISNVHFEQVGKQIHIYYDLEGDKEYSVQVYCSTDNGQYWGKPLKQLTGAVGDGQKAGNGKMIVWDVLQERDKLVGNVQFKLNASLGSIGTFIDSRDGQTYKWVRIGDQVWMAENLNYKTGNCWCYKNMGINCYKYGRLYDWKTARIVCPSGWHLPTDNEWKILEMYLRISQSESYERHWSYGTDEGKKLKNTSDWNSKGNGTDAVGFTALLGGYRSYGGNFRNLGDDGSWCSATALNSTRVWYRYLSYGYARVYRDYYDKEDGFSVRCVRGEEKLPLPIGY
jgi:uncharacterized protein (TIGR02145 family)